MRGACTLFSPLSLRLPSCTSAWAPKAAPTAAFAQSPARSTVAAGPTERSQVIQLVGVFGGEVINVGADRLTVMLAGRPEKIDDFEGLLEQYHVVELQRTGRVALPKLERH